MAAKNITFRLDETLKKQAEIIYESMGLNMSSALQLFVTQTVAKGSIPFLIEEDEAARHRTYVRIPSFLPHRRAKQHRHTS